MSRIKRVLAAAVAVAVTAVAAMQAQAVEWRGWNIHEEGYPNTVAMDGCAELVAQRTDGDITVEVFHSGVLGDQPDAIEQVRIGALEIGNFNLGPIAPGANVVSLPFVFKGMGHMPRALDGEAGAQISAGMVKKGLIALAWYDSGARSFYNSK